MNTFTSEINGEWISTDGKDHWLNAWLKSCSLAGVNPSVFLETSCEITAAAVWWKLNKDWRCLKFVDEPFQNVYEKYSTFKVSIGEDGCCDHEMVVSNNQLIQSFYGKYKVKITPITDEIIKAFNEKDFKKLTGEPLKGEFSFFV